jgi:hypothetical protein
MGVIPFCIPLHLLVAVVGKGMLRAMVEPPHLVVVVAAERLRMVLVAQELQTKVLLAETATGVQITIRVAAVAAQVQSVEHRQQPTLGKAAMVELESKRT